MEGFLRQTQREKSGHSRFFSGTTLIEALALLFIFSVVAVSFYQAWTVGTQMIIESKNRLGAVALANEKMEIVRNLNYDTIGTTHGLPAGNLAEDETVIVNTKTYRVHTFVQYIDDAFDGTVSGTPSDLVPNDYKRVQITVSWGDGGSSQSVALTSTFVPKGIEQSAGGGVLSINVLDAGIGIPQATVHLTNSTVSPTVDITTQTDDLGNVVFPAAPQSLQSYRVEVSKSGYYSVRTYQPVADPVFVPAEPDISVIAGALNQASIVTGRSADITIRTKDALGTDMPNVAFQISGGKVIGTDENSNPIYDFQNVSADSGATASVAWTGRSPGAYTLSGYAVSGYTFLGLSTQENPTNKFTLVGGTNQDIIMRFAKNDIGSALITVSSQLGNVLSGASVHMTNASLGYDATVTTDAYGQAYFPTAAPALANGTYDISVTASGHVDATDTMTINGAFENKSVILQPN